jgi:hypothetical protein
VGVIVNKKAFKEYVDDADNETSTPASGSNYKYIEATSGAEFRNQITFTPRFQTKYGVCVKATIDRKLR